MNSDFSEWAQKSKPINLNRLFLVFEFWTVESLSAKIAEAQIKIQITDNFTSDYREIEAGHY